MSICSIQLLATAATTLSTQSTTAPVISLSTYAWSLGEYGGYLIIALILFFATYGRSPVRWSPPRATGRPAIFVLCLIGGTMVWCFIAVPIATLAFLRSDAATQPVSDVMQVGVYAATCVVGLLVAATMHTIFRRGHTVRMLGLVPLRAMQIPGQTIVAAAVAIPFTYFVATISMLAYQSLGIEHESAHAMLQLMERNESQHWTLLLTILNATLLAPLFEEILFRGHLQTILTAAFPRSRMLGIVITSIIFASIHDAWTAPAIFALSIAIGLAYEWTGSLWVAIAIHVAFNALSTIEFLNAH